MQVLPDHPDYPHFLLWYEFARDFRDLGQAMLGISGFTEGSPAFADWSRLDDLGQEHQVFDLISIMEAININAAMHISAIGSMPYGSYTFLDLPTYSLSRIVMEAAAKLAYISTSQISVGERLTRHFSIHHREMQKNHQLDENSDWDELSSRIKERAFSLGASIRTTPLIPRMIKKIGGDVDPKLSEEFGKIYSVLCGPVHSDTSAIRELSMEMNDAGYGMAVGVHVIRPNTVNEILWMTFQAFLLGYRSYLLYTGNMDGAGAIQRAEHSFREHARSLRQ